MRNRVAASGKRGSRAGVDTRGGRILHVAMKRAMRKVALRDCGQRCVYCATHLDQHCATLDMWCRWPVAGRTIRATWWWRVRRAID